MYRYCKTIWIWSLRLHMEATQWRIQGGQGPDPPPPPLSGKYNVLVNKEYV